MSTDMMDIRQQKNPATCPACNSMQTMSPYLISNAHQIVRCNGCGLLMVDPRPSDEQIRKLFEEEYIEDADRVAVDFTEMRIHSLRREATWVKKLLNGGKLLDLGTASGAFLMQFKGAPAWQVEGVEPSRYGAAAAAEQTGFPVHTGFLRDQNFPDASFDIVTSLDAFMFHPDPRADLAEMARIIKMGGYLAIEIPGLRFRLLKNSGWLCKLIYGVPARLNAGVHLYYYSRSTLGKLVSQFGFEEVMAKPEQSPLYGPWYAKAANWLYYWLASAAYLVTGGRINLAPKEFLVYRKVPK